MTLQKKLLNWFSKNARALPWRRRYDPYEVWISEIMLQQTQMETVLPYFRRWMKAFPTLPSLAKADEPEVLKLWEGLGYYSRARNLRETARLITEKHGGIFPSDHESILSFKGIGRYTAGAIASIAFNQEKPIVDGNILRVLSRVYAIKKPIDLEKNKALFWELEESLIPKGRARDFNQALMELGALVCTPQNPSCTVCPIRGFCRARKSGRAEDYPVRQKKKKTVKILAGALVVENRRRFFLRYRPKGALMGGLWEFPEWKLAKNRPLSADSVEKKLKRLAERELGLRFEALRRLGSVKRNYTHFNETLTVFLGKVGAAGPLPRQDARWKAVWAARRDFKKYPFSAAHSKIAQTLTSLTREASVDITSPRAAQESKKSVR